MPKLLRAKDLTEALIGKRARFAYCSLGYAFEKPTGKLARSQNGLSDYCLELDRLWDDPETHETIAEIPVLSDLNVIEILE